MVEIRFQLKEEIGSDTLAKIIERVKDVIEAAGYIRHSMEISKVREVPGETEDQKQFWLDIIMKDGKIDEEQVMKELLDFGFMINEVPKVYMHVTGDLLSKPNYYAHSVTGAADEYYKRHYLETFENMIEDLKKEGSIRPMLLKILKND